jgi:hypothetical protein
MMRLRSPKKQSNCDVPLDTKVSPPVLPSARDFAPAEAIRDIGDRSRFALARAGEKAAKHLEKLGGHEIVSKASKFKEIVGATSQLHGWDAKEQAGSFSLNVLSLGDLNVKVGKDENA